MDADRLRVNFCSMILQAKGDTISHFVAWLDLKVAEYKVYGHMILTDSDENTAAWSAGNDPTQWPRSKEGSSVQFPSTAFLPQHNSSIGASQPRSYSGLSVSRRGNNGTVARRGRGGVNRARPTRPKSVVANLLRNAISRSARTPALPPPSSASVASSQRMESSPVTTSASDSGVNTTAAAVSDASSAEQSTVAIKMEQDQHIVTLDSDSDGEDVKPAVSDGGLWLSESAGTVDMYAGGAGASVSAGDAMTSASHLVSSMAVPHMLSPQAARSVHKPILTPTTPRAGPSTGPSPLSAKRTPGARDSVTELLETHTVQTDSEDSHPQTEPFPLSALGLQLVQAKKPTVENAADAAKFVCEICSKSFVRKSSLKRHVRVHEDSQPYCCLMCEKKFHTQASLDDHNRTHHQAPKLVCVKCNKKFATLAGLKEHQHMHLGTVYECFICVKVFQSKKILARHMLRHTAHFTCAICKKSFASKSSLDSHFSGIHTNSIKYRCDLCPFETKHKRSLERHNIGHSAIKPYTCMKCCKSFKRHEYIKKHEKKCTGKEGEQS